CSEENTEIIDHSSLNRVPNSNFDLIIRNYYQSNYAFGVDSYSAEYDTYTTEILIGNQIVGYITQNSEISGLADIRVFESEKKLKFSDITNQKNYNFNLAFNDDFNTLVPDFEDSINYATFADPRCQGNLILCTGVYALASIGIAASDGPLPFMDALAASTFITCNAHCASTYDLCVNPPN